MGVDCAEKHDMHVWNSQKIKLRIKNKIDPELFTMCSQMRDLFDENKMAKKGKLNIEHYCNWLTHLGDGDFQRGMHSCVRDAEIG